MACRPEMGEHTWTRVGYQRALQGGDLCDCGKVPYVPLPRKPSYQDLEKALDSLAKELVRYTGLAYPEFPKSQMKTAEQWKDWALQRAEDGE